MRGYNRVDWGGAFGPEEPQRLNRRAGGVVNTDGFTTYRVENVRANLREQAGGVYIAKLTFLQVRYAPCPSPLPNTVW